MARKDGTNDYTVLTTQDLQGKIVLNLAKNRNNPKGISYAWRDKKKRFCYYWY